MFPHLIKLAAYICMANWVWMAVWAVVTAVLIHNRYRSPRSPSKRNKKVAILRPLKGVDANLHRNLESAFRQSYSNFEIICGVESAKDPAYQVFQDVAAKYPNISSKIIVGSNFINLGLKNHGINPKVNNLGGPYEAANAEIIWILDSNVTCGPDLLARAVEYFDDENVGLVHQAPIAVELGSPGAFLDGAFLSSTHFRVYTTINSMHVASCVIGKSNIFRKKDLDSLGGIGFFGKYLSEDNAIGVALWNMGRKHILSPDIAYQSMGKVSFSDFLERRIRWIRVRKYSVLGVKFATYYEPFTECLFCGLTGSISANFLFGFDIFTFNVLHWIAWFSIDMFIAFIAYRNTPSPKSLLFAMRFVAAWFVRELIALPVYLWAIQGDTIWWRGAKFVLKYDGSVEPKFNEKKIV